MIISASYRTDIPTFYGQWFMNRLAAGYCKVLNPYNNRVTRLSLLPEDVEGIIFWTKNIGPFLKHLPTVKDSGFPFIIQHTINAYPRVLEKAVVDASKSVEHLKRVSDKFGPRVCVWRYDTIIASSITPREFHIETFSRLAKKLEGVTDEVVISFAELFKNVTKTMSQAGSKNRFTFSDPSDEWKRNLTSELVSIAASHKMQLSMCAQPQHIVQGCRKAHCIDAVRLADIIGNPITAPLRGNRKECGCYESREVGEYDTCPHGCFYCYAVKNHALAKSRYQQHDPEGESLFPFPDHAIESEKNSAQLDLFDGGEK